MKKTYLLLLIFIFYFKNMNSMQREVVSLKNQIISDITYQRFLNELDVNTIPKILTGVLENFIDKDVISIDSVELPSIKDIAFTKDENYLIFIPSDEHVTLARIKDGHIFEKTVGPESCHKVLCLSEYGEYLAIACPDFSIKIFKLFIEFNAEGNGLNCKYILSLSGHSGPIKKAKFSKSNGYLITSSDDNSIIIWDLLKSNEKHTEKFVWKLDREITEITISPSEEFIACAINPKKGKIDLYDYSAAKYLVCILNFSEAKNNWTNLKNHVKEWGYRSIIVKNIKFNCSNTHLYSVFQNDNSDFPIETFETSVEGSRNILTGYANHTHLIDIFHNNCIAIAGINFLKIYKLNLQKELNNWKEVKYSNEEITSIKWSETGRFLAVGFASGIVSIYNLLR